MAEKQPVKKSLSPWQALSIVWDLLFAIAIPTILFGFSGRWLDQRLGTTPLFLVLGLLLSLGVVTLIVGRKAKDIAKRL
jgi:F0F1-type ATP synthase assembly protein I